MAVVDHLKALIEFLEADAGVSALVAARVYGAEVPRADAASMPRKCVVLQYSGSPRDTGTARIMEFRVDAISYGEIPEAADQVRRAVYEALKLLKRVQQGTTVIFRANHSGGPIQARDRDTDWPFAFDSFDVLAAEEAVI